MDISAKQRSLISAAESFYHWFNGVPADNDGMRAVQAFTGDAISLEELRQLQERLRDRPEFLEACAPTVARWRPRMESSKTLSEQEAEQLLQELFDGFDHALLYDHGVTTGETISIRGKLNDGDKTFSGGMPCWTLHYTVAGQALFLSDNMEHTVGAGDLMLLKPDARYHYGLHPRSAEWRHLWALFQPRPHWATFLDWRELDEDILGASATKEDARRCIEALFRDVIKLREERSPYRTDLQYNRIEEILIRARDFHDTAGDKGVDLRIQQACAYMEAHINTAVRVEDVAQSCNLSPSRFAHLFKEQMGCGPKAWINDRRLQQARKLLLGSDSSISAICAEVGFEDAGHFTRHFKKNVGCSPRQFRQAFSKH